MGTIWQDIRYGVRVLLKSPGFTAVAIFVTALGIGANTAIFSVVNAVLLRPLPYAQPERIVRVMLRNTKLGTTNHNHSYLNFADLRAQSHSFEALAAYDDTGGALTGGDSPERVYGMDASADLFKLLGVEAQLGRTFTPDDEQPGADAIILSHSMWQRRFGADPHITGRQITLGGKARTIIGVLPARFQFVFVNEQPEYFTPLNPKGDMERQRGANYLDVIGRLKAGVTSAQAEAELRAIAAQLEQRYPEQDDGQSVSLVPAHEDLVGNLRRTLIVLLGAVGFVLLVACANVANLQLARAAQRGREMAVRVALGATRARVIRQLLTESLVLSTLGGALGLLFALWGVDLISTFVPADIPRFKETGLDPTVLGFTFAAAVATGLIFGLAPAFQASRVDLNEALKEGGRSTTEGRGRHRVRSLLIVSEVALSLVLLVGAGLLIKSFLHLRHTSPGFNAQHVLTASISLPASKYPKDEQQASFYQQALEHAARLPGVESVGAILPLPYSDNGIQTNFTIEGQPPIDPGAQPIAGGRIITPDYIRAMGIPLLKGRTFDARDTDAAPKVMLINETLARHYFAGQDPIGQRLDVGLNDIHGEIVGVVGDVRDRHLDKAADPEYYVPNLQVPVGTMTLVVRTKTNDPTSVAASLREVVQQLDKDLPLYEVRTMESRVADSVARQRFSMTLIVAFAWLALALAAVGIFSVMSFLVAQRTHEIGVRMALGAQASDILRMIMRHGMALTLIGVAIGLGLAFMLTRLMTSLLYEVSATDPVIFGGIALLLAFVALLACYLPARRATRVDPMVALRYE
ncbi:MAG: hypothetical protein DMF64_19435 [Acidobacteria bacterium]|nr:MAG: hypothetical protein DMF64_19435 [Acidobacteriota bacterium]